MADSDWLKFHSRVKVGEEHVRSRKCKWYVVHTYSGYENKVKADIEKTIENKKITGSDIRSISTC